MCSSLQSRIPLKNHKGAHREKGWHVEVLQLTACVLQTPTTSHRHPTSAQGPLAVPSPLRPFLRTEELPSPGPIPWAGRATSGWEVSQLPRVQPLGKAQRGHLRGCKWAPFLFQAEFFSSSFQIVH